jgi:hypothetical protein
MPAARSLEAVALGAALGEVRTRGLNLEDTRLTQPAKLDLPLSLAALALAWPARAAAIHLGPREPAAARIALSPGPGSRIGFDQIRRLLRGDQAAAPWRARAMDSHISGAE